MARKESLEETIFVLDDEKGKKDEVATDVMKSVEETKDLIRGLKESLRQTTSSENSGSQATQVNNVELQEIAAQLNILRLEISRQQQEKGQFFHDSSQITEQVVAAITPLLEKAIEAGKTGEKSGETTTLPDVVNQIVDRLKVVHPSANYVQKEIVHPCVEKGNKIFAQYPEIIKAFGKIHLHSEEHLAVREMYFDSLAIQATKYTSDKQHDSAQRYDDLKNKLSSSKAKMRNYFDEISNRYTDALDVTEKTYVAFKHIFKAKYKGLGSTLFSQTKIIRESINWWKETNLSEEAEEHLSDFCKSCGFGFDEQDIPIMGLCGSFVVYQTLYSNNE